MPTTRRRRRPSNGGWFRHLSLRVKTAVGALMGIAVAAAAVIGVDRNYARAADMAEERQQRTADMDEIKKQRAADVKDIKQLIILQGLQTEVTYLQSREKDIEDRKFNLIGKRTALRGKLSPTEQTALERTEDELAKLRSELASKKRMIETLQLQK